VCMLGSVEGRVEVSTGAGCSFHMVLGLVEVRGGGPSAVCSHGGGDEVRVRTGELQGAVCGCGMVLGSVENQCGVSVSRE
jgi:hypothetical protein